MMIQFLEQIPDTLKVGASAAAPVLTLIGIPVEQWGFVLSGVVSLMFIFEKLPTVISRMQDFVRWIKNVRRKK